MTDEQTDWMTDWLSVRHTCQCSDLIADLFLFVFFQVFDAYAQFEESMISAKMETTSEMGPSEEGTKSVVFCHWLIYYSKTFRLTLKNSSVEKTAWCYARFKNF